MPLVHSKSAQWLNQAVALWASFGLENSNKHKESWVNNGIKLLFFWIFIVKDQKQTEQDTNDRNNNEGFQIEFFLLVEFTFMNVTQEIYHKVVLSSFPFTFLESTKHHILTH